MPSTPGGLVYPSPTDAPDGPAQLQALAESVEDVYTTGAAWITATTGFTLAANWDTLSVRYRVVGPHVALFIGFRRITSVITTNTAGNPNNVTILSAIPAAIRPAQAQSVGSGAAGRLGSFTINSDGTVDICAFGGSIDWAINESGSLNGSYLLG